MSISTAIQGLINEIEKNNIFDSHYIIKNLLKQYSDEYLNFASSIATSSNTTLSIHGKLGQEIAKFESTLIERMNLKSWSDNIHEGASPCTCWKKK